MDRPTHYTSVGHYTACGFRLERIGDTFFRRDIEDGYPLNVTYDRTAVTCRNCLKRTDRTAP